MLRGLGTAMNSESAPANMKCRLSLLFVSMVILFAVFQQGCRPIEVRIVGAFKLDGESGCGDCPQGGPLVMWFDGAESPMVQPRYRFDHAEGQGHGGTYVFQAVDSTGSSLILYPDSSGPFHADLIGDMIISDYNVRANSITEPCGSGIRRCIWRRR